MRGNFTVGSVYFCFLYHVCRIFSRGPVFVLPFFVGVLGRGGAGEFVGMNTYNKSKTRYFAIKDLVDPC